MAPALAKGSTTTVSTTACATSATRVVLAWSPSWTTNPPARWWIPRLRRSRMTHRGGVAADGLTGDGCGLLIRKPDAFLRGLARDAGIPLGTRYAAGVVFLPLDESEAARCRAELEAQLQAAGVQLRGWRVVPTDDSVCGQLARDTLPRIEQVFVDAGAEQTEDGFTLALFLARRRAEQQLQGVPDFYVTTLSPNGISYKGMVLPDKLSTFYPDLQRSDLSSSAIVFHQRFSTNTLPRWPLAHPFRLLAHNGEINTIEGNRRWRRRAARCGRPRASTLPNSIR